MKQREPPQRGKKQTSQGRKEPRVLSAEEKRELILAHASARKPKPEWGFGYYVGIAASCLVVLTGWWLTLGTNLRSDLTLSSSDTGTEELHSTIEKWRALTASSTPQTSYSEETKARIEALKKRFRAELLKSQP